MQENNIKIFIAHPFEIIRKGLEKLISENFSYDIEILLNIDELKAEKFIDHNSILFIDAQSSDYKSKIYPLRDIKSLKIIGLSDKNINPGKLFDNLINTDIKTIEIKKIINQYAEESLNRKNEEEELSRREKEVLREVAYGLSNKEIAEKLFISIHTVISHRKNITEKLGIRTISGLTVYAMIKGIINIKNISPDDLN